MSEKVKQKFLNARYPSCRPTNSVKDSKHWRHLTTVMMIQTNSTWWVASKFCTLNQNNQLHILTAYTFQHKRPQHKTFHKASPLTVNYFILTTFTYLKHAILLLNTKNSHRNEISIDSYATQALKNWLQQLHYVYNNVCRQNRSLIKTFIHVEQGENWWNIRYGLYRI